MNEAVEEVRRFLDANGIKYQVLEHLNIDGTVSESAAQAWGVSIGDIIKALVVTNEESGFCLVIVPGDRRVNFEKLSGYFPGKKTHLATAEEIYGLTGYRRGGVPPVGHRASLLIVVDKSLLGRDYVYGSAGSPYHGLKMKPGDIVRLNRAIVADITK